MPPQPSSVLPMPLCTQLNGTGHSMLNDFWHKLRFEGVECSPVVACACSGSLDLGAFQIWIRLGGSISISWGLSCLYHINMALVGGEAMAGYEQPGTSGHSHLASASRNKFLPGQ